MKILEIFHEHEITELKFRRKKTTVEKFMGRIEQDTYDIEQGKDFISENDEEKKNTIENTENRNYPKT